MNPSAGAVTQASRQQHGSLQKNSINFSCLTLAGDFHLRLISILLRLFHYLIST
jgi:hypothetical protein